jgi:hypothetical protein
MSTNATTELQIPKELEYLQAAIDRLKDYINSLATRLQSVSTPSTVANYTAEAKQARELCPYASEIAQKSNTILLLCDELISIRDHLQV